MFIAVEFTEKGERKTEVSLRPLTEFHIDAYRMILTRIGGTDIKFHQAAIS